MNKASVDIRPHILETTPSASATPSVPKPLSIWLDGLRVFLLLEVVAGHMAAIALPEIPQLKQPWDAFAVFVILYRFVARFGLQSAFLFIFLSGYFIGGPLLAQALQRKLTSARHFATSRFIRIYPTLAMGLFSGATLDVLGVYYFHEETLYQSQKAYDYLSTMNGQTFLGDLLSLQPTFMGMFGSNGPLWTMGYIVQFYIFGYSACRTIQSRSRLLAACLGVIFIAAMMLRPEWAALFACWTVGAFSRIYPMKSFRKWGLPAAVLLFILANRTPPLPSIALTILSGVLVVPWLRDFAPHPGALLEKGIAPLAKLSFDAYASHYPVMFFIFAVTFAGRVRSGLEFAEFSLMAMSGVAAFALSLFGMTFLFRRKISER